MSGPGPPSWCCVEVGGEDAGEYCSLEATALHEATALRVALRSESLSPAHLEALEVRELVRPQAGSREVSIQVGQETGSSISQMGRVK